MEKTITPLFFLLPLNMATAQKSEQIFTDTQRAVNETPNTEGVSKNSITAAIRDSAATSKKKSINDIIFLEKYESYSFLIDSLKKRRPLNTSELETLVEAYNERAWNGFFLKKFTASENDIRAGIALDSTNIYLRTHLATALLLQGKFAAAQAEYTKWEDQAFIKQGAATYFDAFLADLDELEQAGIVPKERTQDVIAIRKLLGKSE